MPQGQVIKPAAKAPSEPQPPIVKVPDNMPRGDHERLVQEGIKAMEDAAGKTNDKQDASAPEPAVTTEPAAKPEAKGDTTTEPEGPAAKGWALVKKGERKLQEEKQRFELERKQAIHEAQQAKAAAEKMAAETKSLREAFKANPFETLRREFGVTLNDLATMALQPGQRPPTQNQADPEKEALRSELSEVKQMVQGLLQQNAYKEHVSGIDQVLAAEENSVLQTLPNAKQEIFDLQSKYMQQTGERLQTEKAAAMLRDYWEKHLGTIASHSAARRVLGLQDPEESNGANGHSAPRPKGPRKTLTNSMSSSPAVPEQLPDNLTHDEEVKRAAKLVPSDVWDRMS